MTKKKEGNLLNRRDTLRMIGAAGATALLGREQGKFLESRTKLTCRYIFLR
jgi:hypothetical protein